MSRQYRLNGQFSKRCKDERIKRIQSAFKEYRLSLKSGISEHDDTVITERITPPTADETADLPEFVNQINERITEPTTDETADLAEVVCQITESIIPTTSDETADLPNVDSQKTLIESGRHIVELGHIAKQLYCLDCGKSLLLENTVNETRYGFGSVLMIECECGSCREVTTGKTHRTGKRGPAVFDINTKAALGMLHSGSGHSQVEKFMSTLEIQGLHHTSMKKRELEVEPHVKNVCRRSCVDALDEEVELQKKQVSPVESDVATPVMGQCKYDMGWQKRGAGRAYDSKSGVGTMIGNLSGKVCGFGVRSKDCRKCTYHINKGQIPPDHKCSKNWDGSSKSMEPDVAVEVVMDIEQNENVQVGVLIMDDDTTTTSKLRETLNHPFVKWSDMNHTRKHLGNSLYALQKKHKCLTTKVILYIQKCFSYAVAQNKNNPKGLAKALQQIVSHAFGAHENCCDSWCGFLINPEKYKHSSLPYGRDLVGEELRTDLCTIFEAFIKNVDKISPAASTKDVESLNNMIASKAPKRCHYSATSSLHNRVNCAVAEKNIGSAYVTQVNKSIGISPGKFYSQHAERMDKKRKRRLEFENTLTFKKRKLEKKMNKCKHNAQKELREGITYQSSIDLIGNHDNDTIEIPKPISAPELKKIDTKENCSHVYCDIETTGLHKTCDITQIAAVHEEDCFNQYIIPTQPITPGASQVTGLTVINNIMCYKGKPVNAVSLKTALEQCLVWLENRKPCILIGHNFRVFDFPRLVRSFELSHLLHSFQKCVIGFVDTLPLCKELYPGLDKYNQEYLVKTVMNSQYSAHNAIEDVCSLQKLVIFTKVAFDKMCSHSITVDTAIDTYIFEKKADVYLITLCNMLDKKAISKQMALKIARSGLSLSHLRLAVDRGGRDGLFKLFTEKVNGKVRVTSANRIIDGVFNFLCSN